jgi:hypothetical protein
MIVLGKLLALGLVGFGSFRVAIGFYVANAFSEESAWEAANARYLGSLTSGEAIDQGLLYIAAGTVVGLLVRIAAKRSPNDN